MRKILLAVLVSSTLLIACGSDKKQDNTDVVNVESTTTTTTVPDALPSGEGEPVVQETPTTVKNDAVSPKSKPVAAKPVVAASPDGNVIGHIRIPAIGVDWDIRQGIDLSILNKGPGHYPSTPKPCRAGNAAIAAHRTTYGAWFNKLDILKTGDVIYITTPEGDCTYRYTRTEIVSPNNVSVVAPKDGNANELTLTACHPKGSAAQRIVVTATLENVVVK